MEPWAEHGVARVVLKHQVGRSIQSNVFHVLDLSGEATNEHYQAIIDAFAYWWSFPDYGADAGGKWASYQASLVEGAILWVVEQEVKGLLRVLSPLLPILGAGSGPPLPGNATPAITWSCAFGGHKGRGRTYLPGFDSAQLEDGDPNRVRASARGLIEATYNALLLTLRDATDPPGMFRLVVYHRAGREVAPGIKVWADPIERASFRDLAIDSQRARLPHHRRNLT